jgi:hypothetical protein
MRVGVQTAVMMSEIFYLGLGWEKGWVGGEEKESMLDETEIIATWIDVMAGMVERKKVKS